MKKLFALSLLILGAFVFVACEDDGETKEIGFAASTFTNPFFKDIETGIEEELEDSDYELVSLSADDDTSEQSDQMEDLISQQVDLILLNPVDSETVGTKVEEANDAGIPVITVDRGADEGEVVSHVASDNVAGGEMAAENLADNCSGDAPVLELKGISGASAAEDRSEGFRNEFGEDNITESYTADFERSEGQNATEDFLSAEGNPEEVCVFAGNDEMAMGAVQAIRDNEETDIDESWIVGFDAIDDAIESIEDGHMKATIEQQPEEIGRQGAQNALDYLNDEEIEEEIPVDLKLVTQDDVED